MKKLCFILFTICILCISCNNDNETTQLEDNATILKLHEELITLSESEKQTCTNPDEWAYAKLGDACDGEIDIIYSKKINTAVFLKKADEYKKLLEKYQQKWGSDCGEFFYYHGKPTELVCFEGRPILKYNGKSN